MYQDPESGFLVPRSALLSTTVQLAFLELHRGRRMLQAQTPPSLWKALSTLTDGSIAWSRIVSGPARAGPGEAGFLSGSGRRVVHSGYLGVTRVAMIMGHVQGLCCRLSTQVWPGPRLHNHQLRRGYNEFPLEIESPDNYLPIPDEPMDDRRSGSTYG